MKVETAPSRRLAARAALGLCALFAWAAAAFGADPELLPPDQAFRYTAVANGDEIVVDWSIEEGYYLYRSRMSFATTTPGVTLGEPVYPAGKVKEDEFFGRQEVYREHATVHIPYSVLAEAPAAVALQLKLQGCADIGICYPPQTWKTDVALAAASSSAQPAGEEGLLDLLSGGAGAGSGDGEFLPPDEAFRFSAEMADPYTVRAHWDIADGYYLYRAKFAFQAQGGPVQLGEPRLPPGTPKFDETFGDVEVYYDSADVLIPVSRASAAAGEMEVAAGFQGCAEDGICYPPITRTALVLIPEARASDTMSALAATAAGGAGGGPPVSEQDRLTALIGSGSLPLVLAIFFGSGLLLAFTPCVLPMVPILSGLIVGQGPKLGTGRAFALSLTYVLAMALVYTAAGVVTALLGKNLQATFQHPAVLIGFSLLFVVFAAAMLGAFELQMPAALQARLTDVSNRQRGGTLAGVAVMGALSALIVGPCVAAPLAGTLAFIGQSGDPVRGGLVLFALSLGMGAPLLAFGTSAGRLLPRAGRWMESVKKGFGILLLGVAVWMMSRLLPPTVSLLLWGALVAFAGALLVAGGRAASGVRATFARALGIGAFVYAGLTVVGAAAGGTDPLRPLAGTPIGGGHRAAELPFRAIKSVADLDREVAAADGRLVMLDFYADWCVACKELEAYTFTDRDVQASLRDAVLLRADVTANDETDQALLARFGIYGPPTIAFFGPDGTEQKAFRVVGFVPADRFDAHLASLRGR
jgi:thioredoxin:protein disulfide reductase